MTREITDSPNATSPLLPADLGHKLRTRPEPTLFGFGPVYIIGPIVGSTVARSSEFITLPFALSTSGSVVPELVSRREFYVLFEDSTAPQEYPKKLEQKIEALFESAKGEFFEDGMESSFSRQLVSLVKKYDAAALEIISRLILSDRVNAAVASEALRWLGRIDHNVSYARRRWLLERSLLHSSSPLVRDGALLGLSYLDDPNTVNSIKQAFDREPILELRESMEQVLAQLEETRRALPTKKS